MDARDKRDVTSALVDNLLRFVIGGGLLATLVIAPNALQVFDKPVQRYLKTLDEKARQRELRRVISYMKYRDFIADNYKHGLQVTKKGHKRVKQHDFDNLTLKRPSRWDKKWRLVFFDIPENHKSGRDALSYKLRTLGFKPLQKSVWIHPFPCRDEIVLVCQTYRVAKYVTYIETAHIDNSHSLQKKFSSIL